MHKGLEIYRSSHDSRNPVPRTIWLVITLLTVSLLLMMYLVVMSKRSSQSSLAAAIEDSRQSTPLTLQFASDLEKAKAELGVLRGKLSIATSEIERLYGELAEERKAKIP